MTNGRRKRLRVCAIVFVIAGPVLAIAAVRSVFSISKFVRHAAHASGQVVALRKGTTHDDTVIYLPTFTFKTPSGQLITKESNIGSDPPDFSVGQQVPVLFDSGDPQTAKIATTGQLWLGPIIEGILASFFMVVGVLLLRFTRTATTTPTSGRAVNA